MRLIKNWKQAPKMLSVQLIALAALWEGIPEEAKMIIPEDYRGYITLAILVGAGIGRIIDQGLSKDVT